MMAAYCFLAVFYWHRGPCGRRTNINTKDKSPPTLFPLIRCDVEQDGEGLVEAGGGSGGSLMASWSAESDGGRRSGFSVGILKTDVKGNAKCVKLCHLSRHSVFLKVA